MDNLQGKTPTESLVRCNPGCKRPHYLVRKRLDRHELGLEWFKEHFDCWSNPVTRDSGYRILLLDGHCSHITVQAIRYCVSAKIIVLCLPPHATHLLQPLDVSVFLPLSTAYKKRVREVSRSAVSYSVDKISYLQIMIYVRAISITPEIIHKAWKGSGFEPLNPDIVLELIRSPKQSRPSTPVIASNITSSNVPVPPTPANASDIVQFISDIRAAVLDIPPALDIKLRKAEKGACKALAIAKIHASTSSQLIEANKKPKSGKKSKKNYGHARVMNEDTLKAMQLQASQKMLNDEWQQHYNKINLTLFPPKPQREPVKSVTGRGNAAKFASARKPYLNIDVDIFTYEIVLQSEKSSDTSLSLITSTSEAQLSESTSKKSLSARAKRGRKLNTPYSSPNALITLGQAYSSSISQIDELPMTEVSVMPIAKTRSGRVVTQTTHFGC